MSAVIVGILFAGSHLWCPCIAAFSLIASLVAGVVGLGLTIDAVVDLREPHAVRRGPSVGSRDGRCGDCKSTLIETTAVRLCPVCDRAPARRSIGRRH